MCGILITSKRHVSAAKHKRAAQTMVHRGTQGQNMHNPYWNVSHIRLPINGLDSEHDQPYVMGDRLGAMVGEYYDFNPKYECDAKELIANWIAYPHQYLPGMYHGVIIQKDRIRVYQDMLGKKPVYYRKDIPAIASEIKALTALGPCSWNPMYEQALDSRALPSLSHTPYKEIKRVPPHTIMEFFLVEETMVGSHIKYMPPAHSSFTRQEATLEKLHILLRESLRKRLRADVPIGMLCSGGLDSSLLYLMARDMGYDPYVYHIENEEFKYLKMLDIPEDRLVPLKTPQRFDLKKVLYHNETYMDFGSMIPQYYLGQAFKDTNVRVVITGDGADELFAGYKRSKNHNTWAYDIAELMIWHLPRIDKMMMTGTVEARSPYLDDDIFWWSSMILWEELKEKQPLKDLAGMYNVPEEIINREKKPLRYKGYASDKDSWKRTLKLTFKRNFERGFQYGQHK